MPPANSADFYDRIDQSLQQRESEGLVRGLAVPKRGLLNLSDNDYLDLSRDRAVVDAAREAAERAGCGAASSPVVTGYRDEHRHLEDDLGAWTGFPSALIWTSGFSANQALFSVFPGKDDLVIADRLIHRSMISGILRSGARLRRFPHNDVAALERLLHENQGRYRTLFVATESVYSMDGDSPDLRRIAELKGDVPFVWILDEAHALGWYGPNGAGLAAEAGVTKAVDVVIGTLGKTLGSQGAFTLFNNPLLREYLINESAEFIFSTYLSPIAAAAASAAIRRCRELADEQRAWREFSVAFRHQLREAGWTVLDGDSPIVPVVTGDAALTVAIGKFLRACGILVGAIRPPAVPAGGSRLRISLKRSLRPCDAERLCSHMEEFRAR